MRVWVVGSGEYEQWDVIAVAVSVEAAVEAVKAPYGPEYIVRWEEPERLTIRGKKHDEYHLLGHFEAVEGYSVKHTASFDIRPFELHGGDGLSGEGAVKLGERLFGRLRASA